MNILEEFWFGKINPCEQFAANDSEYRQALRRVDAEKARAVVDLSPQQQAGFEKVMDAQMALNMVAERKAFIMGFRLGMQILAASLSDT